MSPRRYPVADAFLAACILGLVVLAALPERWLVDAFVLDDAFYYPRIAMNLAAGRGPTYDGRVWTNGFHPLWEAMLVPLAAVSGGDPSRMLRLSFLLTAALIVLALASLRDVALRLGWGGTGVVVGAALVVFPRVDLWMSLMESGASMAILFAAIAAMSRWELLTSDRPGRVVALGALLAAVFLVRLDFVFLCAAWLVASVVARRARAAAWPEAVRSPFLAGVVLTIVASPYLIANQLGFGALVPVSGRRKQVLADSFQDVWVAVMTPLEVVGYKLGLPALAVLAIAAAALFVGVIATRPRPGAPGPRFADGGVLPGFVAGVAVRFLYLRTFMALEAATVPWYWVPETVLVCLVGAWVASRAVSSWGDRLPAALRSPITGGVAAAAVLGIGVRYVIVDAEFSGTGRQAYYDAATWVREHAAPDARCAMYDSGKFSWYSGCDTVSLNGLIGDEQMMQLALEERYTEMMRLHETDYLVYWADPRRYAAIPPEAILYESPDIPGADQKTGQRLVVLDPQRHSPFLR